MLNDYIMYTLNSVSVWKVHEGVEDMAKEIEPLTSGSIWRRMLSFAFPLFLGNLFQQMYNTIDSLIVGNFVGSSALAAVSSSGNLIFMLIGFFSGISSGAGAIVSRFFGAKDEENLRKTVHTTVAFGLVAGVVITLVGFFFSPQILIWMDTPESVMPESVAYLKIYFAGAMGLVMYNIFVGILQAVGDSRHPLYYLIVCSLVNLVLDLVFIAIFHAGVEGAALATVIAQVVSAGLCLLQLTTTKENYRLQIKNIRFTPSILRMIIRVGFPSGIQGSIISFANVVVQANVNAFGEMAMAGYGAYSKVEGFVFLPINSFTMALTTFVGQNLGAEKYDRIRKGTRFGILVSILLAELIGILVFLFAPQMIAAFGSSPEVVQFGIEKARTAALFYFLLAYSHSISAILCGAGKTMVPMMVMLAFWCILRVAFLTITIPLTHSIQMVYWVYPLTWACSSAAFFIYYRKAEWMCRAGVGMTHQVKN